MHKGYTLNYFIEFFQNIPNSQFTIGSLQESGTEKFCAIGHCLRDNRTGEVLTTNAREKALQGFLRDRVISINDNNSGQYSYLGTTPRGRILKALRLRKRNGYF